MSPADAALARGREELRAARALLDAELPSQALSRAYVAALRAAEAALLTIEDLPATSAGVVSVYCRRVVVEGGLDAAHGRALRRLWEDRCDVDHGLADAPMPEAARAVGEALTLLEATARWIGGDAAAGGEEAGGEHAPGGEGAEPVGRLSPARRTPSA